MGEARTEITLLNYGDEIKARDGFILESEVRQITVCAVVDNGLWMLVIDEKTREKLELLAEGTGETTIGGGGTVYRQRTEYTEYVEIRWKDRKTVCKAVVFSGEEGVSLGMFALEGLDLMIHPEMQEVIGAHGDAVRNVVK
ncbi:MAG: hypothetical protein LBK61_11990 [Spirochaetaceae bacterium]|jgi:hypothetical protein|nr:hypothetical protein [Spirochaetaceae bacterium]